MKKFFCILISIILVFTFVSCGKGTQEETTAESTETTKATEKAETTEATQTTETTETTEATETTETTETTVATEPATKAPEKVSLSDVEQSVLTAAGVSGQMELTKDKLTELYGISQADISQAAGFITVNGAFPEEAVMIQAKNKDAKSRIAAALQTRLDDVKSQSANYDADSFALVQKCKVIISGDYVALFIASAHAQMESAFEAAVK